MNTTNKLSIRLINIIGFCLTIIISVNLVFSQANQTNPPPNEPVLTPPTAEESKLDIREIIKTQPDYTAMESFFFSEGFGGFSASSKVAKKGNQYRTDTGLVIVISELNRPTLRLNNDKTYAESVGVKKPFITPSASLIPTDLLGFEDISFSTLGTIIVDANKLLKIQAKSKEFTEDIFLYVDFTKKNLVTIFQVLGVRQGSVGRLQEISFDVPKEFFDLSGYKAIPKFTWKRVKTAKVDYKGKPINSPQVFRYDDFIFVHLEEFEDVLINLKTGVALTVVFQGELVTKDGEYIWRTTEDEAISVGEPGRYLKNPCKDCVKIRRELNSATIPDPDRKSQTLMRLSW